MSMLSPSWSGVSKLESGDLPQVISHARRQLSAANFDLFQTDCVVEVDGRTVTKNSGDVHVPIEAD